MTRVQLDMLITYVRQLISANDDEEDVIIGTKDGAIKVSVWLEKHYLDNMSTISSNEHVLFIGENQASKNEISSMNVKFDKYGMKYGWLGKRGMMLISKTIDNPEDYNEFIELCRNYKTEFELIEFKKSLPEQAIDAAVSAMGDIPDIMLNVGNTLLSFLGPVPAIAADAVNAVAEATKWITTTEDQRKITDQQFRALTLILYMDGLSEFLEG